MALWLAPVNEHAYQQTLADPVDRSPWDDRPAAFPETARLWGVRTDPDQGTWERNRRNRDRLEVGDPILFYRTATGRYDAAGRVGPMTRTEYVRDKYWNGGPAIDVFVVEDYDGSIDADPETINRLLGYETSVRPNGFWRVRPDRPTHRVRDHVDF